MTASTPATATVEGEAATGHPAHLDEIARAALVPGTPVV